MHGCQAPEQDPRWCLPLHEGRSAGCMESYLDRQVKKETTQLAIVLRKQGAGASLALTLLTAELGKLQAFAPGAKHSRRRYRGGVESLAVLRVTLSLSGSNRWRLLASEPCTNYPGLLTNYARLRAASDALRWLRHLLPWESPCREVFVSVRTLFDQLSLPQTSVGVYQLAFQVRVLTLLGFVPSMARCSVCTNLVATIHTRYAAGAHFELSCCRCSSQRHPQDRRPHHECHTWTRSAHQDPRGGFERQPVAAWLPARARRALRLAQSSRWPLAARCLPETEPWLNRASTLWSDPAG